MSSADKSSVRHSEPIAISGHSRTRSDSTSDSSSESSASPSSPLPTPVTGILPRVNIPISPSTSPILSYFLAQSPKSTSATFPFRRNFGAPVLEDDEEADVDHSPTRHPRRASTAAWAGAERLPAQSPVVVPVHRQDRAAGVLRRLSLGGNMGRPQLSNLRSGSNTGGEPAQRPEAPPNSPVTQIPRKPRRSNTLAAGTPRPARAPSPMGERILKGHFDGFN